ncbi:hypothetical protein ACIQXW_10840 [Lysinibacillus sp. NPDC097162]|uniref:hypothetical protein n=1 Tax=Lysinibacillus sp. NPDC097162 TaxID=3364140 RepID=UPI0037FAF029
MMKAARWYKARDIRVENIEEPAIVEVKMKVHWTGICGVIYMGMQLGQSLLQSNSPFI